MHSEGVRERGCEGVRERGGEEGEENDVKRGKVSEKEHRTFAELSRLDCISLSSRHDGCLLCCVLLCYVVQIKLFIRQLQQANSSVA